MIIRRIVLAWFAMAAAGSLITYFTYSDHTNRWFVVVQAMALSVIGLPVLFLMAILYFRFFKATRSPLQEFTPSDDGSQSGG